MDKQKALKAVDAALKALEAIETALKDNNHRRIGAELWNARRQLLDLNTIFDRRKITHEQTNNNHNHRPASPRADE